MSDWRLCTKSEKVREIHGEKRAVTSKNEFIFDKIHQKLDSFLFFMKDYRHTVFFLTKKTTSQQRCLNEAT